MPSTVTDFVALVRKSGLVESDQLARILAKLEQEAGQPPEDPRLVGKALVEAGLLTKWQTDKLISGRHRGFFLGKYKLLSHLGTGGMSTVYLAEHILMRRRVAIKVLPVARIEDSSYLDRFLLEARAIASLDHPNIVQAFNVDNEKKIYYLVMEYVEGKDLQQEVVHNGPLAFERAVDYIRQSAEGLAHAHGRKMIHRDIKPANLLVDRHNTVKILDMGLARLTGRDEHSLTIEHKENVLGTTDYLAPEQALDSHNVDHRADLYSLGCTLYFLLTGHPPFPEGTLAQRLMKHQSEEPEDIRVTRPDAPDDLLAICKKMMAKHPDHRYQTAQAVAEALNEWLIDHGVEMEGGRDTRGSSGRLPTVVAKGDSAKRAKPAAPSAPPRADDTTTMTRDQTDQHLEGFFSQLETEEEDSWSGGVSFDSSYEAATYRRREPISPWVWIAGGITFMAGFLLLVWMWTSLGTKAEAPAEKQAPRQSRDWNVSADEWKPAPKK